MAFGLNPLPFFFEAAYLFALWGPGIFLGGSVVSVGGAIEEAPRTVARVL